MDGSYMYNKFVHLPINVVVRSRNYVEPDGSLWRDTLDATGQPPLMKNKTHDDHNKHTSAH